MKVELKEMC